MTKPAPIPSKQPAPTAPQKGLRGWVKVFEAGDHIDSKGRAASFSPADLDEMVVNHKLGAAPAVIGHPKDTAPAYAQVQDYKRDGKDLFARFTKINPAFEAGVESGAYFNRSLSVYKDRKFGWRVRHIGWLGAVPPAIDGLPPVEFSAEEDACFEFAAPGYSLVWGLESVVRLLRGLRDQMIAKDGLEAADAALPQWQIDSALEAATQARQEFQDAADDAADNEQPEAVSPQFSKPTPTGEVMSFTQEQLDAATAKAAKDAEDKSRADFAAQSAELLRLRSERQAERIGAQIATAKAAGKLLPTQETGLAEFMASIENVPAEFSFSRSGGEVKKTNAEFFADFMAALPVQVKLGASLAGNDSGNALDQTDSRAIATAAQDFQASEQKAGRVISIESAVVQVMQRGGK